MRGFELRRVLSQVPVTALGLFTSPSSGETFVLAGEDGSLCVYSLRRPGEPLCRLRVFFDQPIHGLSVQPLRPGNHGIVLLWGSCCVALVDISAAVGDDGAFHMSLLANGTAPDWIHHGAICPWEPTSSILVTAHNEVVPLCHRTHTVTFGAATSPSRPMLYAAYSLWTSPSCVLVAGGTVFGDVIVWNYFLAAADGTAASYAPLFTLSGHEGSIYGVDISPEIVLGSSRLRLLASCSDDRTIRIWNIAARNVPIDASGSPANLTWTTSLAGSPPIQSNSDSRPLSVAMGHASRIWGVRFSHPPAAIDTPECDSFSVYSFGEDATAQRWRLDLGISATGAVSGNMVHQQTLPLHDGKHIWANALLGLDGKTTIVTGGADGKIVLAEEALLASSSKPNMPRQQVPAMPCPPNIVHVDIQAIIDTLPHRPPLSDKREIISRYDFVSEDHMIAITTLGRLFLGSLTGSVSWKEVRGDDDMSEELKLVYVVRRVGLEGAVLGTTHGHVFFFRLPCLLTRVTELPGRIVEMNDLSESGPATHTGSAVAILVHLHGSPDSLYLTIDPRNGAGGSEYVSGLDRRFVAVAAAMFHGLLAMGSRHGWLSILQKENKTWRPILNMATPSRDALTCLLPLRLVSTSDDWPRHLLVTSRDGQYRIYQFTRRKGAMSAELMHETCPPFGPMIEGAYFAGDDKTELILYGFRSKDFVVWNETQREELAVVDCGGAHRTFRLSHSASDAARCRFAFTRTSRLSIYSQTRAWRWTIKAGTHGREVRALASNGHYLATGAEDTVIRIWAYAGKQLRCLAWIKAHVTGIQQLRWFGDQLLVSSGGNEELFVWRVRRLRAAYNGLAVVREAVLRDKSPLGDLRIMDLDLRPGPGPAGAMLMTTALSNSTFQTHLHSGPSAGFQLLARGRYSGACLTQARRLVDEAREAGGAWALTASTDGHVGLWTSQSRARESGPGEYGLVQVLAVHQSSIKALEVMRRRAGSGWPVVTGGDDNAISICVVEARRGALGLAKVATVRKAHAAAINGIMLLRGRREGEDEDEGEKEEQKEAEAEEETAWVSVSNDQQVKIWRLDNGDRGRVELVGTGAGGVADAGDVEQLPGQDSGASEVSFVVGGVGLEVWSLARR